MKVGTDGVLLGAWVDCSSAEMILDIGTGTGVVALMLAQRNSNAKIQAVEINEGAVIDAKLNFEESPFTERMELFQANVLNLDKTQKFDLIVCNPPYFSGDLQSLDSQRNVARHDGHLNFVELVVKVSELLIENGEFAVIIPSDREKEFIQICLKNGLYSRRRTRIRGRADSPIIRSLLQFGRLNVKTTDAELVIETERHIYTEEYIHLTKDFYLKM